MINKVRVRHDSDGYTFIYSVDNEKNFTDALRQCKSSIKKIIIEEDADVGLASYGGSYTFDQLDEMYDLDYLEFDSMYVFFENDDTWFKYRGFKHELSVITMDSNFDFETFIAEKKSTLIR